MKKLNNLIRSRAVAAAAITAAPTTRNLLESAANLVQRQRQLVAFRYGLFLVSGLLYIGAIVVAVFFLLRALQGGSTPETGDSSSAANGTSTKRDTGAPAVTSESTEAPLVTSTVAAVAAATPVNWIMFVLLLVLSGVSAFVGYSRSNYYLVSFGVSLFGFALIILETIVALFPVPIFGPSVVIAGIVLMMMNYARMWLQQYVENEAKKFMDEATRKAMSMKTTLVNDAIEYLQNDPQMGGLKDQLDKVMPQVIKVVSGAIEANQENLKKAILPLIEKAIEHGQAKAVEAAKAAPGAVAGAVAGKFADGLNYAANLLGYPSAAALPETSNTPDQENN